MTLDEAIAELRIDRSTSPDQTRRAYLRLLKERKPEVDPDGFQRLREAYELLRSSLAWRQALAVATRRVNGSLPAAAAAPAPSLEGKATEDETTGPPTTVAAPTAGEPTGTRDAELPRVVSSPAAETTEGDPDFARLDEVWRLVRERHRKKAAALLAEHYEAAAARPGIPVLPPPAALDLLLRAHENGWLPVAARLERGFALWLETVSSEVRVLGADAPKWAIARELGALPSQLSPEVRATLARAGRTGELDLAMSTLRQIGARDRSEARDNARILCLVGRPFSTKAAAALAPSRWAGVRTKWRPTMLVLSFAMSALLRVVQCAHGADAPGRPTSEVHASSAPPAVLQARGEAANAIAKQAMDLGEGAVAERARAVRAALWEGNCSSALARLTELMATPMPPALSSRCQGFDASVKLACGADPVSAP